MTIVTLVHGTFAKNAAWTHDTSPLAKALRESIQGDVRIEAMNWSGHNLHSSRCRAAKRLKEHVKSLAQEYPGSRQFVIAHSHGGNVAMYALNDPEVRKSVTGVVSLSTPFILCRQRVLPEDLAANLVSLVLIGIAGFLAFRTRAYAPRFFEDTGAHHPPDWLQDYFKFWSVGWIVVTLCLAWFFKAIISRFVLGRWKGSASEIHQKLVDSFAVPPMASNELMIVRAPGDEASAALGASTFGLWMFGKLSAAAEKVFRFGEWLESIDSTWPTGRKAIWSISYILFGSLVLYMSLHFARWEIGNVWGIASVGVGILQIMVGILFWVPPTIGGYPAAFNIWGGFFQIAYAVLAIPCLLMCAVFTTAFGYDVALLASLFEFSVESSPVGNFSVLNLSAPTTGGLWHSLPYNDKQAFQAIVKWINGVETKQQAESNDQPIETDDHPLSSTI